jgi:GTPase
MFVDKVRLSFIAGRGGDGVIAWRREKFIPKGGPCGGDGGRGGSIIIQTDDQIVSLEHYRNQRIIKASNGQPGGYNYRHGKSGKDLILKIPYGTLIKDALTDEILYDFIDPSQSEILCKGGRGGKGNDHFKSPTNQAPYICTEGKEGEAKEIEFELKLIADIGLIGMPNAGKSSLMKRITHREVKIGAYPFTTLFPNLSYIKCSDASRILVADIPGIIEEAHLNKGLGLEFLRHIERSKILIYVIDASGEERGNPLKDFYTLQKELSSYKKELLEKPSLVVLNKMDLEQATNYAKKFYTQEPTLQIYTISALKNTGIDDLLKAIINTTKKNGDNP